MRAKKYMVSIDFYGASRSLDRLATNLVKYWDETCPKRFPSRSLIEQSIRLCLVSPLSERASLDKHLNALIGQFDARSFIDSIPAHIKVTKIILSVGVLYYEYTCSICLSRDAIMLIGKLNVPVEFVCYPTSGKENETQQTLDVE